MAEMRIAIVGAGAAGLAAARALQSQPNLSNAIYERADRAGGRIATGRRPGYAFDHGAQLIKTPSAALQRLLTEELAPPGLRDVGKPVWIFDDGGRIAEGDPALNAEPKWTCGGGLDEVVALLAEGLDIRLGMSVASLRRAGESAKNRWSLLDAAGQPIAAADVVLLTPPAPQAAAILAASSIDDAIKAPLLAELARASYRRCISIALAYPQALDRPFYALVNVDRAHPIAWLALEHAKGPERCPPGHSLLIAQMGARWSAEQWDASDDELGREAAALAAALLGQSLGDPLWHDIWRWPYALPDSGADFDALNRTGSGLLFA